MRASPLFSASSDSCTLRNSTSPATVSSTPRPTRLNKGWPSCSSSCCIWWLMADCDRYSSSAAREKLPSLAAASKPLSRRKDGIRGLFI